MAPLQLLLASAFSLLSPASPWFARAAVPALVVREIPSPSPSVASFEAACPLPHEIMRVLDTLEIVGVTRIDWTSKLVSHVSVSDTERLPVRVASWALVSEPPRMPLLYSRMVQLDF